MQLTEQLNVALEDRYRVDHEIGRGGMAIVYRESLGANFSDRMTGFTRDVRQ